MMDPNDLNLEMGHVVDLFVMAKFQDCFEKCNEVISSAQIEPEQERNDTVIEAACALGIQALAEIDRWMDTVAFITTVYGGIDLCPPRIIQVCILLHAHVHEFLPCHSLVQAWLKNPHNLALKQCGQVIKVYASHVLCPSGCQDQLHGLIEKCVSLTRNEKAAILEHVQNKVPTTELEPENGVCRRRCLSFKHQLDKESQQTAEFDYEEYITNYINQSVAQEAGPNTHPASPSPENKPNVETDPILWMQATALDGFNKVFQFVSERFHFLQHPYVRVFLMGMLAVAALIQSQTGDVMSSLGRLVILWRGFLQRLSSLVRGKSR